MKTPSRSQIAELTARREALREEIARMADHKHGTPWHTERVDEIHAITRRIHLLEDEQMAAERQRMPDPTIQRRAVPLGPLALRTLDALCCRYRVESECVLRAIAEQFLSDACEDCTLAPAVADEARFIRRTGALPLSWWQEATELQTPGFEKEAQSKRDIAQPLPASLTGLSTLAGRRADAVKITLEVSPAGAALLALCAAHDGMSADVEGWALKQLSGDCRMVLDASEASGWEADLRPPSAPRNARRRNPVTNLSGKEAA